jgi:hypothetical protein
MYYKNRYYETGLGRFVSRDPIGYEGGLNFYRYAASNITIFVDSLGLLDINLVVKQSEIGGKDFSDKVETNCGSISIAGTVYGKETDVDLELPGRDKFKTSARLAWESKINEESSSACIDCCCPKPKSGPRFGWVQIVSEDRGAWSWDSGRRIPILDYTNNFPEWVDLEQPPTYYADNIPRPEIVDAPSDRPNTYRFKLWLVCLATMQPLYSYEITLTRTFEGTTLKGSSSLIDSRCEANGYQYKDKWGHYRGTYIIRGGTTIDHGSGHTTNPPQAR